MELSRQDIATAAEMIDMYEDDFTVREAYAGRGVYGSTCAAVDLPAGKLTEFMVALAVQFTEDGRADDALELARATRTDSMGTGTVVYWPGVELTA